LELFNKKKIWELNKHPALANLMKLEDTAFLLANHPLNIFYVQRRPKKIYSNSNPCIDKRATS